MSTRGAGYSLTGRDKHTPEDRWALAELDELTLAAVADGVSDPLGTGQSGASGAVADAAVAAFVEHGSRLFEAGERDPVRLVHGAFMAAIEHAERECERHDGVGGAALIGACLTRDGVLAVSKVGDCRVSMLSDKTWVDGVPGDDADRRGSLTRFVGHPDSDFAVSLARSGPLRRGPAEGRATVGAIRGIGFATPANRSMEPPGVIVHEHVRAAVLMTDGAWRQRPPLPVDVAHRPPFTLARDLVSRARRLGEGDDLTAVVLTRPPDILKFESRLSPWMLVVAALMFLIAGYLLAAIAPARASSRTHHILILDDSGSMESDFDVHGFGLAIPQLFARVLGDRAAEDLTVLLLPQRLPIGPVPRLTPDEFLTYPRENGTAYYRSVEEALEVARTSSAPRVEIALITDAEPNDTRARRLLDSVTDPRVRFSCFQLGTSDPGDLCAGRSAFANDGFELTQVLTTHLARTLGSLPRWGRLDPRAQRETELPLSRYVSRLHVFALGTRAGEDFTAELRRGTLKTPLIIDHTRPLMSADMLQLHARRGPRPPDELPVGPSPRLTLGTLSVSTTEGRQADVAMALRLTRADGPVAWGVILEYDLTATLEVSAPRAAATLDVSAPPSWQVAATAGSFEARARLLHKGVAIDDLTTLAGLGLTPQLLVSTDCDGAAGCPPERVIAGAMTGDAVRFEVPADLAGRRFTLTARFTSDTALIESAPGLVSRTREGAATLSQLPGPPASPTPPPTPTPSTKPTPTPVVPAPVAPTPQIGRWIPPTLDLPDHVVEGTELGYALTVVTHEGKTLTGPEIEAEGLSAVLVYDGQRLPLTLNGDRFELRLPIGKTPSQETPREAHLELITPSGTLTSNRDTMVVLPDQALAMAPLKFEDVPAGCDTTAHCQAVSLSGRRLDIPFEIVRSAASPLTITARRGEETWLLTETPTILTPGPLELCVAPAGCDHGELSTISETVIVRPADPRLQTPDRSSTTTLTATVLPSPWLTCNLWWIVLTLLLLLILFIAYGYIRPDSFSTGAILQVADQERRLAKDPGRPLRTLPHGRRGFYRTATCALDSSGFTVKRSRPHVLALRADRLGIALLPRASIERKVRGRWVAVDRETERHVLPGATYRVNQAFVFRVLA